LHFEISKSAFLLSVHFNINVTYYHMKKSKILFVSQEICPYMDETHMSKIARHLPQGIQEKGKEIRTFMPRFGCVNERRNQLHEVIRLSGMNLIINDTDHPLIIKVASIQAARMQVYFIDNEEYFQRKFTQSNAKGKFFEDNDERAIFFCRGVLETVKKLGWAPDVVHCHGWMTSLLPIYLKKAFREDPIYANTKVIYSVYNDDFEGVLNKDFGKKLKVDGISDKDIAGYKDTSFVGVTKAAIEYSDAIIIGSEKINPDIKAFIKKSGKPTLQFCSENEYIEAYSAFYDEVQELEAELV
jgi:starch synthase